MISSLSLIWSRQILKLRLAVLPGPEAPNPPKSQKSRKKLGPVLLKINLRQITIFFSYYVFSLYSRSGFSAVNNGIVVNTLVVNHNVVTYKNIDAAFLNHAVFFLHFKPNFFTFLQKKYYCISRNFGGRQIF